MNVNELTLGKLERLKKGLAKNVESLLSEFMHETNISNIRIEAGIKKEDRCEGMYVRYTPIVNITIKL